MTGFSRSDSALVCDGVPLAPIAEAFGTPLYVYSAADIAARYRAIDDAFADYPHRIHYALKANSTLAIVRLLRELGSASTRIPSARSTSRCGPASTRRRSCSPAWASRPPSSSAPSPSA